MSRKSREDKSSWRVPSIHVFAGDYGPFKPRDAAAIENALLLLTSTAKDVAKTDNADRHAQRHPLYEYAVQAQNILLGEGRRHHFRHLIIVDVADMVAGNDGESLGEMIRKEIDSTELVKGFGKTLVRTFQRMSIQNAVLAAEGEMCCVLLKLYNSLGSSIATDIWLLHPNMPAGFINTHLVPMGKQHLMPKRHGDKENSRPLELHLVFQDDTARAKREDMIRFVFPSGTTAVTSPADSSIFLSVFGGTKSNLGYDPDYCDPLGKSLFLSKVKVEMNSHSKQYERKCEEITDELLKVVSESAENVGEDFDWKNCERHVGALVLRGNRCVLVRSLTKQWAGMRIPSVVPKSDGESPVSAAIRSVVEFTGVEESEVMALDMIPPVNVYAPNGRRIIIQLYPLYATSPPPDGPLEDADMEDDESMYDWYTLSNALKRLDERSSASLRSMATILLEAANVGILPAKYGGVFGQELTTSIPGDSSEVQVSTSEGQLTVPVEKWMPSRQGDMLQDVRQANADILSRLSSNRKNGAYKLPVTLLSGFLGSGKTTLLSHILSNYDGLKVAILVNDMAEVNIDAALVKKHSVSITQGEEHLVEMSNGCICCTLREDLLIEVAKIASQGTFDYLIIESSGVSEPMPVAETFTFEDSSGLCLGDIAQLDTLVTVVDGSRFKSELDSISTLRSRNWHIDPEDQRTISHLLCDQIEFASVIVLNKCDLMSSDEKVQVKNLIKLMNPAAKVIESVYSVVPLDSVLGTGLFSLSEAEKHDRWLKEARIGEHTPETVEYGISSITYRAYKPFYPRKLKLALDAMLKKVAPFDKSIILRAKGFVWLATFHMVQGDLSLAGQHYSLEPGSPWWAAIDREDWPTGLEDALSPLWKEPFGDRQQEIVIIGQGLDEQSIVDALNGCLLTDEDVMKGEDAWNQICSEAGDDPFYEDWYAVIENIAGSTLEHDHGHSHDHGHNCMGSE